MRMKSSGTLLVLLAFCATASGAGDLGSLEQLEAIQSTLATVADAAAPCVVAIRSERPIEGGRVRSSDQPSSRGARTLPTIGTGMIVDSAGLVLTNEHVIHGAKPDQITCVLANGDRYKAISVQCDLRSDLAVVHIDARNLPSLKLGDARTVRQGHFAIVLGNPFGLAWDSQGKPAMSFGIISALGRPLTRQLDPGGERYYGNLIQTDARINPGNSGGPLLNIRGEVIGVTTAISTRSGSSEGVGYAIPMNEGVRAIVDRLKAGREVEYGFLGVRLDWPTAEARKTSGGPASGGALITEVETGTPAEQSKLSPGDLVVQFDGADVEDAEQLIRLVGAAQVGVPVDVTYYRGGAKRTVRVIPARRQVAGQPPVATAPAQPVGR